MDSDFRTRRGRLRGFSINRLIPNVLTLAALCAGLTAIRFGLQGQMELAVIAIMVAAVLDALDGRVARRLGVTSRFGAELDSLSDFLCFGVTPALILYMSSLTAGGALGWVVTLMFPMCSALRLARFNTALVSDTPPPAWTGSYFTGVPAPAGALLALVGAVNVPVIYFSVRWWNTLHQGATISMTAAPKMASTMLTALLLLTFSFWAYSFAVVFTRARAIVLEQESDAEWVRALAVRDKE